MHKVHTRPTAADRLTASRFVLAPAVGAVALTSGPRWLLGLLISVALLTDLVDGRLARATGTATARGARLDQEADAVLILVLSAIVAADLGLWVVGIGLARYVFGALFSLAPALRTPPAQPRAWCKAVAALTGVTLGCVAVLPLPPLVATGAVVAVALLLAESFGHEAVDRWRAPGAPLVIPYAGVLAFVAVWLVLVAPADRGQPVGHALARLPIEMALVAALALVPWQRLRVGLAAAFGVLLALVLLVKVLDLSFQTVFDRGFDPVGDWSYFSSGIGVLGDSIGSGWAGAVAVLAGVATVAVLVGLPVSTVRLVRSATRHRRSSLIAATVFVTVWVLCSATGVRMMGGTSLASATAVRLSVAEVRLVRADMDDGARFAREIRDDPYAEGTAPPLLAALAGKDVLLVFVESYGRSAVQGTSYSAGVDRVLDDGTRSLTRAGYLSRSAFLTSPTFGGLSWLAHSTLQSGLWVNSQRRYDQLLGADRTTLTSTFAHAGWHTVSDVPSDTKDWPEGQGFYGFEDVYDARNVGYRGPKFGYAQMPDQYTLAELRRRQLTPGHRAPVIAEVDLVSSHNPWTPLPRMVAWDEVGDGSVYDGMPEHGPSAATVFADPEKVKQMYGRSVEYSWQALTSFLTTYSDPNLVVVVLGDHQPYSYVSGDHADHDVPVSVIAQDPDVIARIAGWDWQDGLHPSPSAPTWRMDTFRDRFLDAFS